MRTLGLLLAGGRGARLGGDGPKALAVLGGRTLLERAREILAAAADDVRVVAPDALALPGAAAARIPDAGEGPLVALVAAFAGVSFERACVLGVDLPLVPPALYARLADAAADGAAMACADGREQPLVSVWTPAAARALAARAAAGDRGLVRASLAAGVRAIDVGTLGFAPDVLANVNTPDDFARVESRLAAAR